MPAEVTLHCTEPLWVLLKCLHMGPPASSLVGVLSPSLSLTQEIVVLLVSDALCAWTLSAGIPFPFQEVLFRSCLLRWLMSSSLCGVRTWPMGNTKLASVNSGMTAFPK